LILHDFLLFTLEISDATPKGLGRKFSRGANGKKDKKLAKNTEKIALFSLFWRGGATKKRPKIANRPKIAILSLYLICTMFENPGVVTAPPAPRCRHAWQLHLQ